MAMLSQKILSKAAALSSFQNILPARFMLEETLDRPVSVRKEKKLVPNSNAASTRDISFSGSGFLAAFHLGAANALMKRGILTKKSKLAGASGGALIAASLAADMPVEKIFESMLEISHDCRSSGTFWRAGDVLRRVLSKSLPDDAAERCSNRATIAVTRVRPLPRELVLADRFESKQDLVEALVASCFVPFYLEGSSSVTWREGLYVDGGMKDILPPMQSYTKGVEIGPHVLGAAFDASILTIIDRAIWPADEAGMRRIFEWGDAAAHAWADSLDTLTTPNPHSHPHTLPRHTHTRPFPPPPRGSPRRRAARRYRP